MAGNSFGLPIPLSEIESVLAWVDTFKLSRPTKKINRDFSDAVLLAEMLMVHYPKLVEMHNYPPRNSHALKLNNWMTLNRKVLKKLKLNLCCNTMQQLANSAPGIIERVLVMVRDKIRRDEELNKTTRDAEQNVSSGGSYYEACGDDDHVLVVPVKTRVNGVLETIQQKVISHDSYLTVKEELKDAKDIAELLKQRVEHLDSLLKLKDERIEELQKQLERKQIRRKEIGTSQSHSSLAPSIIPVEQVPPSPAGLAPRNIPLAQVPPSPAGLAPSNIPLAQVPPSPAGLAQSIIPLEQVSPTVAGNVIIVNLPSKIPSVKSIPLESKSSKHEESKIPVPITESISHKVTSKPSLIQVAIFDDIDVDRIKSDIFKEAEVLEIRVEGVQDAEDFKDSEQGCAVVTIEESIQKEVKDLSKPIDVLQDNFN